MHLDQDIIDILKIKASTKAVEDLQKRPKATLPEQLPILGLSDIVIFPGMVAPLLIESAPSSGLVDDVVSGNRLIGLVLQTTPDVEEPEPKDLHPYGCMARVQKMVKQSNNSVRILIAHVLHCQFYYAHPLQYDSSVQGIVLLGRFIIGG